MRLSRLATLLLLGASATAVFAQTARPKYGSWGVDYATMDTSVKPGDDFFGYAEGTWLKNAPIPSDRARAGYNYDLPDLAERDVRAIVEKAATNPGANPATKQVVDFYTAWMDEAGIEARGIAPLKPYLARIAAVKSTPELVLLMAEPGYAAPIRIGVTADDKDPTRYTVTSGQARLGLPTRDYYLLAGAKYDGIRKAYRDYVIGIQKLAGFSDAEGKADRIIALETALSKDQWTPEQRRDPQAQYNP